eukprot:3298505-Rhodomonas_salina.1
MLVTEGNEDADGAVVQHASKGVTFREKHKHQRSIHPEGGEAADAQRDQFEFSLRANRIPRTDCVHVVLEHACRLRAEGAHRGIHAQHELYKTEYGRREQRPPLHRWCAVAVQVGHGVPRYG